MTPTQSSGGLLLMTKTQRQDDQHKHTSADFDQRHVAGGPLPALNTPQPCAVSWLPAPVLRGAVPDRRPWSARLQEMNR